MDGLFFFILNFYSLIGDDVCKMEGRLNVMVAVSLLLFRLKLMFVSHNIFLGVQKRSPRFNRQ